jgi:hypothetical protein
VPTRVGMLGMGSLSWVRRKVCPFARGSWFVMKFARAGLLVRGEPKVAC